MPDKFWLGDSGDLNAGSNYTGGTKPLAGDRLFFAAKHPNPPTSNLNALAAVGLSFVQFGAGFPSDVGTPTEPLELSATKVVHEGAGTVCLKDGGSTTGLVIIDSPSPGVAAVVAGDITRLNVVRGLLRGTSDLDSVSVLEVQRLAKALIDEGAGAIAQAFNDGGEVTCSAAVTALLNSAGRWLQKVEEIATGHVPGGSLVYNSPASTGTMGTVYVGSRGVLDLLQNTEVKAIGTLMAAPGAQVKYNKDLTTITNDFDMSELFSPHGGVPASPTS